MASVRTTRADLFPDGTTVTAYPLSNWSSAARPPSGAPVGASAGSGVMANGAAVVAGLASGTQYMLYASVSGQDRYVNVTTPITRQDRSALLQPNGAIASSVDRGVVPGQNFLLTSGQLMLVGLPLLAGDVVQGLSFSFGSIAVTLTGRWFSLWDREAATTPRARLAVTADDATAVAAEAQLALNLTAPYTVQVDGLYYAGITEVAATASGLRAVVERAQIQAYPPIRNGLSTAALTNAASAPAAAAAPTAQVNLPYVYAY